MHSVRQKSWVNSMENAATSILGLINQVENDGRYWLMFINEPLYEDKKEGWIYTLMAIKHSNPEKLKVAIFLNKWNGFGIKDGSLFLICKNKGGMPVIYQSYAVEDEESWAFANVEVNTNSRPDTGRFWEYREIWRVENWEIVLSAENKSEKEEWEKELQYLSEIISNSEFISNLPMLRTKYGLEMRNSIK